MSRVAQAISHQRDQDALELHILRHLLDWWRSRPAVPVTGPLADIAPLLATYLGEPTPERPDTPLHELAAQHPVSPPDDADQPTRNHANAARAAATLTNYGNHQVDDFESLLIDLVADLLHLADALQVDTDHVLSNAAHHHQCEVQGDGF